MSYSFFLRIESTICLTVILFVGAGPALSQPKFGTIVGTVRDSSGALLPSCVIKAERVGTPFSRSTMADEAASYVFPNLAPGVYKISMMAPGFQVAEYARVQLLARQTVRLDGKMQLATQTETVSVVTKAVTSASNYANTKSQLGNRALRNDRQRSIQEGAGPRQFQTTSRVIF
jgi:hypothetical protein